MRETWPTGVQIRKEAESIYKRPQNTLSGISPQVCLPFGPCTTTSLLEKGKLLTDDWYVHEHHLETLGVMGGRIRVESGISIEFSAHHLLS